MSRRASLFALSNPGRRRVRFTDEVVFDDNVRENDEQAVLDMLRRASVDIDVNRINSAGLTALHQASLDGNLPVVTILLRFGADVNCRDADTWTPLHAACAMSHHRVISCLLEHGADTAALNCDHQRPLDLVDPGDSETIAVVLPATIANEKSAAKFIDGSTSSASSVSETLPPDDGVTNESDSDETSASSSTGHSNSFDKS